MTFESRHIFILNFLSESKVPVHHGRPHPSNNCRPPPQTVGGGGPLRRQERQQEQGQWHHKTEQKTKKELHVREPGGGLSFRTPSEVAVFSPNSGAVRAPAGGRSEGVGVGAGKVNLVRVGSRLPLCDDRKDDAVMMQKYI